MTDQKAMEQIVAKCSEATKRVMEVTQPTSFEDMIANVVAMKFLGEIAFEMLDDDAQAIVLTLCAAQGLAFAGRMRAAERGEDA